MNPMRQIRLEKITLNMGAGDSAQKLEASKKILEKVSGKKVVLTRTSKRTTFGMPKKKAIGVKVTLRKNEAEALLKKLMKANENVIKPRQFDRQGSFSFGVKEYIHIPGVAYDPALGILGLDVAVTLERPGFRVKKRRKQGKVGKRHAISREEAMAWAEQFGFKIQEREE